MKAKKYLGIWMDHAVAHLMELTPTEIVTTKIASDFSHQDKEFALSKNENLMHNKEQDKLASYFKKLGTAIVDCEQVLLFGPTDAKSELYNVLKADHRFEKVKLEVKQSDKLTENQQIAFVKHYFRTQ